MQEALALWVERERRREEILAAIDEAEASLVRGEGVIITKSSMRELAEDVKRRGRARLRAEEKSGRWWRTAYRYQLAQTSPSSQAGTHFRHRHRLSRV